MSGSFQDIEVRLSRMEADHKAIRSDLQEIKDLMNQFRGGAYLLMWFAGTLSAIVVFTAASLDTLTRWWSGIGSTPKH